MENFEKRVPAVIRTFDKVFKVLVITENAKPSWYAYQGNRKAVERFPISPAFLIDGRYQSFFEWYEPNIVELDMGLHPALVEFFDYCTGKGIPVFRKISYETAYVVTSITVVVGKITPSLEEELCESPTGKFIEEA